MSREPGSGSALLVLGSLGLAAAFVFTVLPRWWSSPVVTTQALPPPASNPQTAPPPTSMPVSPAEAPPSSPAKAPARERRPSAPVAEASPPSDDWAASVSAGLAALDRGAFAEARDAFARAESLRPGAQAVADGLSRAQAGLLEQALREHRQKGEAAEALEDWRAALAEYDAALKLEPAVSFAVLGRTRCSLRAALDERLRAYLDRPDRLAAEAVAREAAVTLEQAGEVEPAGPRLRAQRSALESLLAGLRKPVAVRLVSDGLTEVTILRVGALGAFKEKAVDLRPGSYVVVGARAGYRDARRTLVVPIGRSPAPLDVRCDEAL